MLIKKVTVASPAKVNLYLGVGRRREDGYHDVDDVLQSIALDEKVTVELHDGCSDDEPGFLLRCNPAIEAPTEDNLVFRAADALAAALDRPLTERGEQMRVSVEKGIPEKAGLGGGSSDAAAMLVALCDLWGVDAHDDALTGVAKGLGSDVPFFLHGGCAHMTGRGDTLVECFESLDATLLLLKGEDSQVSTAAAYRAFDAAPVAAEGIAKMISALRSTGPERLGKVATALYNNLEAAAGSISPDVAELLAMWRYVPLFPGCLMCGSGAAIFVICDGDEIAQAVSSDMASQGLWACTVHTCDYGAHVVASNG